MGSGAHYDRICLPAVWKFSAFARSSPSLSLVTVSIWSASITTDSINGCRMVATLRVAMDTCMLCLRLILHLPPIPKASFPSSSIGDESKGSAHNL